MENKIREPIQKRSIEKKEKIIKTGFELICKKGYYNVNTAEIAKEAGVSTGIVYNYFKDKKDIFMEGVKEYSNSVMYPSIKIHSLPKVTHDNLEDVVQNMIDSFIKKHKISKSAHEELIAMSHLDPDIAKIFNDAEIRMTNEIVEFLATNNFKVEDLPEKIHLLVGIVENLCHEIVYHKHSSLDYDIMKTEVIKIILNILN